MLLRTLAMLKLQFFAGKSSPLSFFEALLCGMDRSSAGGDLDESESYQLSPLWQDFTQGDFDREAFCDSANAEMPAVSRSEALERWIEKNSLRGSPEVPLSRLRISFLSVLSSLSGNHPFFFCILEEGLC